MKRIFCFLIVVLAIQQMTFAQIPNSINYQAIVRNDNGDILTNANVSFRFTVHKITSFGPNVYQESQTDTTNQLGLVSLRIGEGSVITGSFSSIDWINDENFLQVEVNIGNGFVNLGTTQFVSVPYSLAAAKSIKATDMQISDLTDVNSSGASIGQVLKWDGTKWMPQNDVGVSGGDDWGAQVVEHDLSLVGDGTTLNPLGLGSMGAFAGNVLKWNGTNWVPDIDNTGANDSSQWVNHGLDIFYSAGRVAIGTDTTNAMLHVEGNSTANNPQLLLSETDSFDFARIKFQSASWNNYWLIEATCNPDTANERFNIFNYSAGTEMLTITGDEKVGINTVNPMSRLHVNSNDSLSFARFTNTFSGKSINDGLICGIGSGNKTYLWSKEAAPLLIGTNDFERLRIETNGDIGIGTSTPTAKVEIVSNTAQPNVDVLKVGYTLNSAYDVKGIRSTIRPVDGYGYGGYFEGGYFGIYATTNNASGAAGVINAGGFDANNTGNGATYGVKATVDGTGTGTKYAVYGSANGNGTKYAGYFVGNVYATGTITSSDEKLKENISPLSNSLATILALSPSSYVYRTKQYPQMNLPEGTQFGLIAQQVEAVLPQIVSNNVQPAEYDRETHEKLTDEIQFKGLNYTELIPVLVGAIQDQQKIIDKMQKEIDELKSK